MKIKSAISATTPGSPPPLNPFSHSAQKFGTISHLNPVIKQGLNTTKAVKLN